MSLGIKITIFLSLISALAMANQREVIRAHSKTNSKVIQIFFNPGMTVMTGREKAELHGFLGSVEKTKRIKTVKILSWSDREAFDGEVLDAHKIELAKARGESIKNFLKNDLKVEAKTYNMAERPADVADILNEDVYEDTRSTTALILVMLE